MSTITAEIDGQVLPVDLHRVTGLDAISFRYETGAELDVLVASWIDSGTIVMLADLAVAKWLYVRQNVDRAASLAAVAATVTLLPAPSEPDGPGVSEPVAV